MSEEMCSICHNNIKNEKNIVITECSHKFHFTCLLKNIKQNHSTGNQCPLCRSYFDSRAKVQSPPPINRINIWQDNVINWRYVPINRAFINRRAINRNIVTGRNIGNRNVRIRRYHRQDSEYKKVKKEIEKLTFQELKEKMRSHNISTRGYLRTSLERRLINHILRENN